MLASCDCGSAAAFGSTPASWSLYSCVDTARGQNFKLLELVDSEFSLTQYAIENLDDAFESALLRSPPKTNSSLAELQAWLSKARQ